MTLMLSTTKPFRFVPNDQATVPEYKRIAYLLAVPTPYTWAALERAIKAKGAVQHNAHKMFRVLSAGVADLLAGEADRELRERYLAEIDGYLAHLEVVRGSSDLSPEEMRALIVDTTDRTWRVDEIANRVRRGYAPYAELEADNDYHLDVLRIETVRTFLVGWENIAAEFARGRDGVLDDLLRFVPDAHLWAIRGKLLELRFPTETQRKNSNSPSRGPAAGKRSKSMARKTTRKKTQQTTISGNSPKSESPSSESILGT